ncbi:RidA family protein [Leucobacter tenebrionis]|uniref:RidA family protein n=1 Tax=Leucobacter tenebrionis TaxID=2873270 RepID=UPI001CA749CB|nr:RidA family protein [Leucobacter tenebrionis]QZY50679.1 RidA family protein [Leucobacter tenebrionis]
MTQLTHLEISQKLETFGYPLPEVQAPLAAYTPALQAGNFVFTSGQLPLVDGVLEATGKVGAGGIDPEQAARLAARCAVNALAALVSAIGDLGRVKRVAKLVGFVASDPSFTEQSLVIDGASRLLHDVLGEAGVHARSAVGVATLPKDSPVEVELIVELHDEI